MCIKDWRKAGDLTQVQLAERIGVTQPVVAYWEAGTSAPSLLNLIAMAKELGCTIDQFCGKAPPAPPPAEAAS